MENGYNKYVYTLTVTSLDKPDENQLMDFINDLSDLLDCEMLEIEEA